MILSSVVHSILIKNAVSVNENPLRRRMFRARRVAPAIAIAPAGRDGCRSGISAGAGRARQRFAREMAQLPANYGELPGRKKKASANTK
jgi:hypothetical protein